MKKILLTIAALSLGWPAARAQLIINELMQSNIDCIMDDLNDFPDSWVELYNSGESAVNLKDYRIGITENADEAWQLPNRNVQAGQYALVYCDKASTGMHTPFRLDSGKGAAVYLFNNKSIADKVTGLKKQPAPNIAYGRQSEGSTTWGYQVTPTPGAANCGRLSDTLLGEPLFSEKGRVVTGSRTITLTLTIPDGSPEGTVIYVTTDGSEPTQSSKLYTSPLSISKTTTVRAKLFCDGCLSPRSTTHSYIFFPRKLTLPVISIVTNNSYFYHNTTGIYVNGTYQNGKENYKFNWRRPVNIEFFEREDEGSRLNQLCETRVQGGASRGFQLKSLAVYAHKRFGTKRLNYEFFPDQRPGITDFKSIILRNAGNDFDYLYMRDAIIQRTMAQNTDLDWQAWRPAIIYINGTYQGMLNIRERSNEDNIYTNYDGLEDIDMIENWNELKEGDTDHYDRFKAFYAEHNHTLEEYAQWIDWEEFINLMVMNMYYNNQDFPGNNIVMWRPRTEDGRWRFIAKDTDFGLGLYGSSAAYKTIEWLYTPGYDRDRDWANKYEHTRLFRRMMEDADFRREFIDRAAVYMGDFMNSQGTRAVWDPMYDLIKTEYPNHRKLINQWWPTYTTELTWARNWLSNRTANFYQQLSNYYKLGSPVTMQVNKGLSAEELEGVQTTFNGIRLTQGTFDGKFFINREVTLSGTAPEGTAIRGWKVNVVDNRGATTTQEYAGPECTFNIPTCSSIVVNAILGIPDGIENLSARSWTWSRNGYQLLLQGVPAGTRIALYGMRGQLLHQTVSTGGDLQIPLRGSQVMLLKVGGEIVKFAH